MISFQPKGGGRQSPPYVALSYIMDGTIYYSFYDIKKDEYIREMARKETFEEAKEIINSQEGSK